MSAVLELFSRYPEQRLECFAALGDTWSACDGLFRHVPALRELLRSASTKELAAMMDDAERAALVDLPNVVTLYRGCYAHNINGLSWSLDQRIASLFPFHDRYRAPGQPILVRARANKRRLVFKLDRHEREVIAVSPRIVGRSPLLQAPHQPYAVVKRFDPGREIVWMRFFDEDEANAELSRLRAEGKDARVVKEGR